MLPTISSLSPFEQRNRIQGVRDFENRMAQYPGAAPGGTGATGLSPTDARGWSHLLEDQQQYLADKNELEGKAAPTVRFAGYGPGAATSDPGMGGEGAADPLAGLRAAAARNQPVVAASVPRVSASGGSDAGSLSAVMGGLLAAQGRNPEQIAYQLRNAGYLDSENVTDAEDQARIETARRKSLLPYQQAMEQNDMNERMATSKQGIADEEAVRGAQRYFGRDVTAQREDVNKTKMSQLATQYLAPEQLRYESTMGSAGMKLQGDEDAADARELEAILRNEYENRRTAGTQESSDFGNMEKLMTPDMSQAGPEQQAAIKSLMNILAKRRGLQNLFAPQQPPR